MSFLDLIKEWFQSETARNKNSSILAGLLFFTGWWILIDVLSVHKGSILTGEAFIGVFGTISFFMVNTVKNSHLSEDNVAASRVRLAKVWLLIGFVIGFSAIIAAVWVMVNNFASDSASKRGSWPGVAILIQNVFILVANLVYKFGRIEDNWTF